MQLKPDEVKHCLLTTLREKSIKIGVKVVLHGRYIHSSSQRSQFPELYLLRPRA